ncbi:hypothetical protein [Streptomyces sp. 184]|uniref:hypothetical protein n=1 Tax=Streptomyces sp. 184 TaxID=1827526 RepID=UPI00389197D0
MVPFPDLDRAVEGADVVVALTSSARAVVEPRHLAAGGTVLGLGGGAEISAGVLTVADRFFVDDPGYAGVTGSVAAWLADGLPSDTLHTRLTGGLPAVAAGMLPGRTAPSQRILAVVQGLAARDVALATLALNRLDIR